MCRPSHCADGTLAFQYDFINLIVRMYEVWLPETQNSINSHRILHLELWAHVSPRCSTECQACRRGLLGFVTDRWEGGGKNYPLVTHDDSDCCFLRIAGLLLILFGCSKDLIIPHTRLERSQLPGSTSTCFLLQCLTLITELLPGFLFSWKIRQMGHLRVL